jgi:ubiquinone/menaquinone biosynthesis C-methylase UbiE
MAITMREDRWRPLLRDRALSSVPAAGAVLDVGAGTGTLALSLAAARPDVAVTAIDGDEAILALAEAKAGAETVRWQRGLADDLPIGSAEADAVVMSLMLHHLGTDAKRRALREAARVLRPGRAAAHRRLGQARHAAAASVLLRPAGHRRL